MSEVGCCRVDTIWIPHSVETPPRLEVTNQEGKPLQGPGDGGKCASDTLATDSL
jgi:hypothetical protein